MGIYPENITLKIYYIVRPMRDPGCNIRQLSKRVGIINTMVYMYPKRIILCLTGIKFCVACGIMQRSYLGDYLIPDAMQKYLEVGNVLKFLSVIAFIGILQLIGTLYPSSEHNSSFRTECNFP